MQSVQTPAWGLRRRAARGRRWVAPVVLAAALAAVVPRLGADDAPAPAARAHAGAPAVATINGHALQQADCTDWNSGTGAQRSAIVAALARDVGGPTGYGPASTLASGRATSLFTRACAGPIASHWLLYEMYIRAAGFHSDARPGVGPGPGGGVSRRMGNERVVVLRPRTVVMVSSILIGIAAALWVVWIARHVITWILIALFLALALDPGVRWLQARGVRRRGAAAGLVYAAIFAGLAALGALFIPTLVNQINDFVDALPRYVSDLTRGRGPLGFLETKYHVVERVREAVSGQGGSLAGGASAVLNITKSIATGVAGVITIGFMTFFMLLEGPVWIERAYGTMRPESERRWRRVGHEIYRIIGGYVSGN